MIGREDLLAFVESVVNYFSNIAPQDPPPQVGLPYPRRSDFKFLEFTGAIGVTGSRKGCVYVTVSRTLLGQILERCAPGVPVSDELLIDCVGELANTVVGNMQTYFGDDYRISVPIVVTGKDPDVALPLRVPVFLIPFTWLGIPGFMGLGVE